MKALLFTLYLAAIAAQAQPGTPPAQFHHPSQEDTALHPPSAQAPQPPTPADVEPVTGSNPATFALTGLMFDGPPNATTYRIYVTPIASTRYLVEPWHNYGPTIGVSYVVGVSVATNFYANTNHLVIPHLLYGQTYWLQAQTLVGTNVSDMSLALSWPQTRTNGDVITVAKSYDLNSTNWVSVTGATVVVINDPGEAYFYRVQGARTNNVDPYQIRE